MRQTRRLVLAAALAVGMLATAAPAQANTCFRLDPKVIVGDAVNCAKEIIGG